MAWWPWPLLLAPLLLVPALWNGGPFVFHYDTVSYVRRPADLLGSRFEARLFPQRSTAVPATAAPGEGAAADEARGHRRPWQAGRSVWYGLPAALVWGAVSVWALLGLQALAVALPLGLLWFRGLVLGAGGFAALVATVGLGSTAGVLASLVLPDVLTGVAVVAATTLILFERRLGLIGVLMLVGLAGWAAASHDTHLPLLLGMALLGAALAGARVVGWRGPAAVAGALGLGLLAGLLFHLAALRATGEPPTRFPFVAARLAATPPGLAALDARCPAAGLLLCDHRQRIGTGNDGWTQFLFSRSPEHFSWVQLNADERARLASEQGALVRLLARERPLDVALLVASDWAGQLGRASLSPLVRSNAAAFAADGLGPDKMPPAGFGLWFNTRQAAGWELQAQFLDRWFAFVALASLLAGALLWRRASTDARLVALLLVLGWLGHAIIVATLARPYDRFGARVLWLVPAAMAVVAGSALARPRAAYPRRTIS